MQEQGFVMAEQASYAVHLACVGHSSQFVPLPQRHAFSDQPQPSITEQAQAVEATLHVACCRTHLTRVGHSEQLTSLPGSHVAVAADHPQSGILAHEHGSRATQALDDEYVGNADPSKINCACVIGTAINRSKFIAPAAVRPTQ
jgi:hypothetical protein